MHTRSRTTVLVVPLILVNVVALYGQTAWAAASLHVPVALAVLFAAALESVGLYLAAEAHSALMAGDAAGKLRAASYGVALVVGGLNYAHWAPTGHPTPAALAFGMLSTLSPWLWAVRSRSRHRDDLRTRGLIDPRAVKFSTARWLLYPARTFRVFRAAVWVGENDPTRAVELAEPAEPATEGLLELPGRFDGLSKAEALRVAWRELGSADVPQACRWLARHGVHIDRSYAHEVARRAGRDGDQLELA